MSVPDSEKATLEFRPSFHSTELNSLEFPVEVRKPSMRIVARTLSSKQIQVAPGKYVVTSRLPAGQEIQSFVTAEAGGHVIVELTPADEDCSPSENLEVQHFLRSSIKASADKSFVSIGGLPNDSALAFNLPPSPAGNSIFSLNSDLSSLEARAHRVIAGSSAASRSSELIPVSNLITIRWFSGNVLGKATEVGSPESLLAPTASVPIAIPPAVNFNFPVVCQLDQPGHAPVNMRVPLSPLGQPPELSLLPPEPRINIYRVGVRLAHKTADLLTRYLRRSMLAEASNAMSSDTMTAEQLLESKVQDPIAAAVGAYTLLRMSDIDRLHDWTSNLMNWFAWLPDGAAICGEHLARTGRHAASLEAFCTLAERGLPLFSEGLSYSIDRLRLYVATPEIANQFETELVEKARTLLGQLREFATFADFDRIWTSYTGQDPTAPSDRMVSSNQGMAFMSTSPEMAPQSAPSLTKISSSPSDDTGDAQEFVFNGINAQTGEYLVPPMTVHELADLALNDRTFSGADGHVADRSLANHLQELKDKQLQGEQQSFGLRFGIAMDRLEEAGWGVIFARDTDPRIAEALKPLFELRRTQAGKLYKEFINGGGYAPNETKDQFLARHGMGPGPADPPKVPYYLMLVGEPESIPYDFQYQLDVQYAVGRVAFSTIDDYAMYARSVVMAETGKILLPRKAVCFGPRNNRDRATQLSADQLLLPLAKSTAAAGRAAQWETEAVIGSDATQRKLKDYLGGPQKPALLFTASHGMGFPANDPRQLAHQGALLCQDWPGPGSGAIDRSHYFAGEDILDSANVAGMIGFHFACYGAGTPRLDDFAHQASQTPAVIAPRPFVAALPRRMLSHPAGSALAFVGHVERAWGCSIVWPDAGRQIQAFEDAISALLQGLPIGFALEFMNQKYADISSALSAELLAIKSKIKAADELSLALQWTSNNDARSYVIFGDPAVRLPLVPHGSSSTGGVSEPLVVTRDSSLGSTSQVHAKGTVVTDSISKVSDQQLQATQFSGAAAAQATATLSIPLNITVSVSVGGPASQAVPAPPTVNSSVNVATVESFAIAIDQDYDQREGYDQNFLGGAAKRVPMPELSADQRARAAIVSGARVEERYELKYHHYSVVLNAERQLAFYTAVNIDGKLAGRPAREKDKWFFDPRIPKSSQLGEELYSSNPFDRGHLVRRLDPAWGRSSAIIKRANDDTFHFTNCSPQHERFNQGKNLWAGLEDYLLDKAADEDRRMTVFTGPVFTDSDPEYRGVRIPKQYWKVAVVVRPNGRLAGLGFLVDQEKLLKKFLSFGAEEVAQTFQLPIAQIEELTGLRFGKLSKADAGSVASFAPGETTVKPLESLEQIRLPSTGNDFGEATFATSGITAAMVPPETVTGTDLRYYLIAYDENGRERRDHPAGIISELVAQAVVDPSVTDIMIFSHGWQGDVPAARQQYTKWIAAMAANASDREKARQQRPGFKPVLVGIHWPSLAFGDESLALSFDPNQAGDSDPVAFALGEPSLPSAVETYMSRLGDTPEQRAEVFKPLRKVLELTSQMDGDEATLPLKLQNAYRELDAAVGLSSEGVGGDPSNDREPFDAEKIYEAAQDELTGSSDVVSFGGTSAADRLLAPLRSLTYWRMKDRGRRIGEGAINQLLVQLQQLTSTRDVRFHLIGQSFGCIVVSGAVCGKIPLARPVHSLSLLQGAVSLWSYCSDIPYLQGTAGYYHRLVSQKLVNGPIVTTRSIHDRAVGTWYPLASRANRSVAFAVETEPPKYGGIGTWGIKGPGMKVSEVSMAGVNGTYNLAAGSVTNVEASEIIKVGGGFSGAHSDIAKPEVAHLVWSAISFSP